MMSEHVEIRLQGMHCVCPHCREQFRLPADVLQEDMQKVATVATRLILDQVERTRQQREPRSLWLALVMALNVVNACYQLVYWGFGWNSAPPTPFLVLMLWTSIALMSLALARHWWPR